MCTIFLKLLASLFFFKISNFPLVFSWVDEVDSISSSAATRHHLPCSAIPRNHLLLLLLLVSISLPPPLPPPMRLLPHFSPVVPSWCQCPHRLEPGGPNYTRVHRRHTTQYTAQGSRAAGLLTSVIIAAQLLLQPSSFSQLVLWHLLVAAHRLP